MVQHVFIETSVLTCTRYDHIATFVVRPLRARKGRLSAAAGVINPAQHIRAHRVLPPRFGPLGRSEAFSICRARRGGARNTRFPRHSGIVRFSFFNLISRQRETRASARESRVLPLSAQLRSCSEEAERRGAGSSSFSRRHAISASTVSIDSGPR